MIPKREEWVKARDGAGGKANLVMGVNVGDLLSAVQKKRGNLPLDQALQASARETKALVDGLKKYKAAPAVKKNKKLVDIVDRMLAGIAAEPAEARQAAEAAVKAVERAKRDEEDEKRRLEQRRELAERQERDRKRDIKEKYASIVQGLRNLENLCEDVQNGRPESFDNATKWTSGVVIDLEKLVKYEVADAHSKALDMLRKAPTYNFARFLEGDKKREAEQFRQLLVTVRELMQSTPPPSG